jgi:hypothetical protein
MGIGWRTVIVRTSNKIIRLLIYFGKRNVTSSRQELEPLTSERALQSEATLTEQVTERSLDIGGERPGGLIYQHTGLPTDVRREDERYIAALGAFLSVAGTGEFGIEWWRFEENAPVPDLLRSLAHVSFKVVNLAKSIEGKDLLLGPIELEPSVAIAFIQFDGFPIQFIQIDPQASDIWAKEVAFNYHSVWQPRKTVHVKDVHLEKLKMYAAQYENDYGIGWVRYYDDAPYPDIVKNIAHVVYEVDEIETAMEGRTIIIPSNNPDAGLWVGFIEVDGAPVEFIQIDRATARA